LDALPTFWERLMRDIGHEQTNKLRRADPLKPETIWPHLRVISCWGEGAAALTLADLRKRFPTVCIQPKGLLATEAFLTFPFADQYPLAVQSHFFEFINSERTVIPTEEIREGEEYEIVITTAGGLWRYRLGDRVLVTGWLEKTPSLKFLGRKGNVSDRFGEKLSEPFVAQALTQLFGDNSPRFALLAPDEDELGCRYTLYVEERPELHWVSALDRTLRRNPHYTYCRDLGQLLTPRIFQISAQGFQSYAAHQAAHGARLGDIKPVLLSSTSGWSNIFCGEYFSDSRLPQSRSTFLDIAVLP